MVKACDTNLLTGITITMQLQMAGLPLLSMQTVTAKVHLSQSSFLEDTPVCHGVSDMINFILSQATQAQATSQ